MVRRSRRSIEKKIPIITGATVNNLLDDKSFLLFSGLIKNLKK